MHERYVPNARTTLGASELPDGEAYYAALVRYYTTLDSATPDNVHERGLREVARIREEMNDVIAETGFDGSFDEFLEFLRTDPQFYARTPEELLMRAAWIAKKTDGRLPAYFGKLPRQPYSVEPVPAEIAPNYTAGRYVPAPPGGPRGGQYWVNTHALETRALYQLVALSLHEGVPGHHLQGALAYEVEDAPRFRQHFYPHAYGEGWGLYVEKLGVEMGLYDTPYDHFGRLSYEMWRACRLVIDTGIHAKGWTREQAVDYLASNTALSKHEVGTEIDRYIAWPGQALAYKIGELTLWDLRREAEAALGDAFDIREFHDVVLTSGGVPLELLRSMIRTYIDETRDPRRPAARPATTVLDPEYRGLDRLHDRRLAGCARARETRILLRRHPGRSRRRVCGDPADALAVSAPLESLPADARSRHHGHLLRGRHRLALADEFPLLGLGQARLAPRTRNGLHQWGDGVFLYHALLEWPLLRHQVLPAAAGPDGANAKGHCHRTPGSAEDAALPAEPALSLQYAERHLDADPRRRKRDGKSRRQPAQ
jgi:hypothetical protein